MQQWSTAKKEDASAIFALLETAFPPEELRTQAGQAVLFENPQYRPLAYWGEDGSLLALLAAWVCPGFWFVEHFAVSPSARGAGLGEELLRQFLKMVEGPVLLETELPFTPLQKRRIAFYERSGFCVNPYPYTQPPLRSGQAPLPLCLLSFPALLTQADFIRCRDALYACVYNTGTA